MPQMTPDEARAAWRSFSEDEKARAEEIKAAGAAPAVAIRQVLTMRSSGGDPRDEGKAKPGFFDLDPMRAAASATSAADALSFGAAPGVAGLAKYGAARLSGKGEDEALRLSNEAISSLEGEYEAARALNPEAWDAMQVATPLAAGLAMPASALAARASTVPFAPKAAPLALKAGLATRAVAPVVGESAVAGGLGAEASSWNPADLEENALAGAVLGGALGLAGGAVGRAVSGRIAARAAKPAAEALPLTPPRAPAAPASAIDVAEDVLKRGPANVARERIIGGLFDRLRGRAARPQAPAAPVPDETTQRIPGALRLADEPLERTETLARGDITSQLDALKAKMAGEPVTQNVTTGMVVDEAAAANIPDVPLKTTPQPGSAIPEIVPQREATRSLVPEAEPPADLTARGWRAPSEVDDEIAEALRLAEKPETDADRLAVEEFRERFSGSGRVIPREEIPSLRLVEPDVSAPPAPAAPRPFEDVTSTVPRLDMGEVEQLRRDFRAELGTNPGRARPLRLADKMQQEARGISGFDLPPPREPTTAEIRGRAPPPPERWEGWNAAVHDPGWMPPPEFEGIDPLQLAPTFEGGRMREWWEAGAGSKMGARNSANRSMDPGATKEIRPGALEALRNLTRKGSGPDVLPDAPPSSPAAPQGGVRAPNAPPSATELDFVRQDFAQVIQYRDPGMTQMALQKAAMLGVDRATAQRLAREAGWPEEILRFHGLADAPTTPKPAPKRARKKKQ